MAKTKVAINGFGRIGRLTVRYLLENPNIEVVAINDLTDNDTLAHLFKYDTAHGIYDGEVAADDDFLHLNGQKIHAFSERDPKKLPWKKLGIETVLEATGVFRSKETAGFHLKAGAKRVVISAPANGEEPVKTIVLGVNSKDLSRRSKIISNASCTTNCLAPMAKILDDAFGLQYGLMTTTHAYTAGQRLQDAPHKDLRRARAAAENIVPTTTGAAKAVALVLPKLKGKLDGAAIRVPIITGSLTELNAIVKKKTTAKKVNKAFEEAAAEGPFAGIVQYNTDPIVSSDIVGNRHSCIFDAPLTKVMKGNMVRILAWYDNEAGYSSRLAQVIENY